MALRYLFSLLLSLVPGLPAAQPTLPAPSPLTSVAFHYGPQAPWDELRAFDLAIVEPDHLPAGALPDLGRTRLAAYISLGEIQPSRSYAARLPAAWLRGENSVWGSRLVDQSQPGWPAFFAEQVVAPLWQRGLRTFFVDTLDSYQLFARTEEERAAQEAGMVTVIRELARRYPGIRFIYNRGFEILPQTSEWVDAVAAESLFRRYDATNGYMTVPENDRVWLLARLREARERYRLPVIAIDYVAPTQRELARETARAIQALGIVPWVATPALDTLGVSSVEVMPRKVLVVHSAVANEYDLRRSEPVVYGSMPLQHLGYVPEFVDIAHLPEIPLAGRYAGVVVWLGRGPPAAERERLLAWLKRQRSDGLPLSFVNQIGFLFGSPLATTLGLPSPGAAPAGTTRVEVAQQDAMLGFESHVRPQADGFYALEVSGGTPLLTLRRGAQQQVAAALTPWGGYVLDPYALISLPGSDGGNRWVINPFEFFRRSLRLPDMPVPDVTTESGRRLLLIHMDGDGFVSRSELPGHALAGEVLRDRVVRRYPLPMTISVIEAELSPQGLYPQLSAQAEKTAREIFSAPHVAIASHSYTHPFNWSRAGREEGEEGYHLKLAGYRFDLQREIEGSVRYIESRLTPAGKKVEMFLWTGDCVPGADAVEWTLRAGLLNMNGGTTTATRSQPTVSLVEGLGLPRGRGYQVFAPNQNENVYTNNWRGPFYGFDRVIETYEFTEKPRRLKPINLYFHTYLLTKRAGMQSFDHIMAYVQAQETTPVHAADYVRKVLDFQRMVVARTAEGWRIMGATDLRTLRLPANLPLPDLARSRAVAGYRDGAEGRYVHLADATAELVPATRADPVPRLVSANARIGAYAVEGGVRRWTLEGQVPLEFTLADASACRVRVAGRELQPVRREAALSHYTLPAHAARPLEAICQR